MQPLIFLFYCLSANNRLSCHRTMSSKASTTLKAKSNKRPHPQSSACSNRPQRRSEDDTANKGTKDYGKAAVDSSASSNFSFRAISHASETRTLTDGVALAVPSEQQSVIMPCVGFGTYKLGEKHSYTATLDALRAGYRAIDTAFIYGGETTERAVGRALQTALQEGTLCNRNQVFVTTKQWRKHHGYEATKQCCATSLQRLQCTYIDLYLMHWPGPAYTTMNRRKDLIAEHGPWYYASTLPDDMAALRAATWRAMEDLQSEGKVRAIGVSNFTVQHLQTLKQTARVWPPAVNQVECHPLFPQAELRDYCQKEGIVLQAYAALGGQDGSKKKWLELFKTPNCTLLSCNVVTQIAKECKKTPAQVLLRYALQRNCAVIPKTTNRQRMEENATVFDFTLTDAHMQALYALALPNQQGRLCWRTDPLRSLDFE